MPFEPRILGVRVDPTSYEEATSKIISWAQSRESRLVCVANVHMIMEAHDSRTFKDLVNAADLITPDGMPLVWILRRFGYPQQERVYGPDLTLRVVDRAASRGISVGFYGGSSETLDRLINFCKERYPSLKIPYFYSPPFRALMAEEDAKVIAEINASNARILFVGLGCPKQERWMAEHRSKIQSVMIGVGAAFDYYAGTKLQAPHWMQKLGLEWLFRLSLEPHRLGWRYLYHNPRFLALVLPQILLRREK
jgi:N-acetylglucosaminyldiphosphoundecaprenol N-acetyl-beta-D-mannosaminyltransferase